MIVIPMSGMSSRFFKAGYSKPKYMLEAHDETLFEHSLKSFKHYFSQQTFLFIVKDIYDTPNFVKQMAEKLRIKSFYISVLTEETRGQAETVTLGLEWLEQQGITSDDAITIFNIDTFRPDFVLSDVVKNSDGYLEVFKGHGDNWSFAKPKQTDSTEVIRTAEKNPISDLCSTGLYHFNQKQDYLYAYYMYVAKPQSEWENGELYIAPLYNILIDKGLNIHYSLIERDEVIFFGIPSEYESFKNDR
ncbi:Nucleoside-diphosphate-sugar pyrophosphorylase involved in lipopolysaccharide biosynthesis/translation initiation factor 2B, gamma/epsilon subunits (eIF-2Bgamma/eIF-2Bepsilon) [Vibrio owensii]|uniref:glycosyltransferase family 2 protein n=1 Tax=Vibrio owensii TaxID=696485 RepID=UPI002895EA6F|nr:Nucleoside-diphosphate-sugar pyrophosphorylase involved in lipopolysaccharide biosynthesis/translation initiation factor 2B, gamma/epsilon subunits (eIF-2Bgamma/eIF-2Bepsilon) [Vibrio owensii]CAH1554778.1 Nucleoside-diphosphate-sugar pyrophosphorylase involved in lipopolysaccharide biosynthesis/translation initiation factor 2B, gamma/epsilon subunits (eIF-2Bgamma/eIF-2Bepsilon) [Vibrio owensii]